MTNGKSNQNNPPVTTENTWDLILFVAGNNPGAQQVLDRLEEIFQTQLTDGYQIDMVDVLERPEQAHTYNIIATPMLMRRLPKPERRILGNLSLTDKVLEGLGFPPPNKTDGYYGKA